MLTTNDLVNVFRTIPANEYDGADSSHCLVGYPIHVGQLHDEWLAYRESYGDMTPCEWLAVRYNTPIDLVRSVYSAVADCEPVRSNVSIAIQFAEMVLVGEHSVEEALYDVGAESIYDDEDDEDDEYE